MRHKFLKPRQIGFAIFLLSIVLLDVSNDWEVPLSRLPQEFFERYIDEIDPYAKPAVLLAQANSGNAQAQYIYALRHTVYAPIDLQLGENHNCAFHWTERAAQGGHSRAMSVLALYYLRGTGTTADIAMAKIWAEKSVQKSQPMGYRVLGDIAKLEAEKMLPDSIKLNDKLLFSAYASKIKQAYQYYQQGANAGDRVSARLLSEGLEAGLPGMPRNYQMALAQLTRAALRRDIVSIRRLADRYEKGDRIPLNLTLSYAWRLVLIEIMHLEKDRQQLESIEAKMPLAEIQRGQEFAQTVIRDMPSEASDALSRLNLGK